MSDYGLDIDKLKEACLRLKISEPYISDISFCPHLVGYIQVVKNVEDVCVVNVNDGRYASMKNTGGIEIIECDDLKNFIIEIYNLKYDKNEVDNALF